MAPSDPAPRDAAWAANEAVLGAAGEQETMGMFASHFTFGDEALANPRGSMAAAAPVEPAAVSTAAAIAATLRLLPRAVSYTLLTLPTSYPV